MKAQRLVASATLLALAACDPKPSPNGEDAAPPASPQTEQSSKTPKTVVTSIVSTPGPRPPAADVDALAKANNAFAFALYDKLRAHKGSLAFSPFSAETALTMAWVGAKGETAKEMQKVLGYEVSADKAADVSARFAGSFGGPVTFRVANRLFGERSYPFERSFLDASRSTSGAALEALDFKGASDASRKHINDWVSGETQGRIHDLLPPDSLSDLTRLVIVNAVYFLGDWESPFKRELTRTEAFHTSKAEQHGVPMMHQQLSAGFAETPTASLVDLPYVGGELAMTIVVPKDVDGLDAVEAQLSPALFDQWIHSENRAQVNVALPKFTLDPSAPLALGDALTQLGMTRAFDRDQADFTGIAAPKNPDERLYVSKVFQKAFVKVDEKGTEAAAATAVSMDAAGAEMPSAKPKELRADHPFLFFLRDRKSNAVLFAGRVADPSSK